MAATEKARQRRKRAAAAAFTLLGIPPAAQAAQPLLQSTDVPTPDRWSMDASFLSYTEAERIDVLEPQFGVRRDFADNRSLSVLVTVDSISGATPLGTLPATPKTAGDTVTNASGQAANPIVGKIPLSNMTDTRYALDTAWQQPIGTEYTGNLGLHASKETDFIALGTNGQLARDFNQKNTTFSLGVSPEFDISNPNGGVPFPYATQFADGSIDQSRTTRWLVSGLAGLTQVINRQMLMQFNYGYTHEQGYLNDPYKLLSIVDTDGNPVSAVYESRPRDRNEQSFYWLTKYNVWAQDVASMGLRYYTDDWGIRSQTLDFTYRRQSTDRFFWEPHVRYYHQSSADFYHIGFVEGDGLPEFASSDMRLAAFNSVTFGVHFGFTMKDGSLLVLRAEYFTEAGESHPQEAVGEQRSFDLFPTLYATILQVEYHFEPGKWLKK